MYGDIQNALRSILGDEELDAAVLGSRSHKDFDLFIAHKHAGPNQSFEVTRAFLPLTMRIQQELDYEIIIKHEHRHWVSSGRPILHLLFYPSYIHLAIWELPSFLAYVHDRGQFFLGSKYRLEPSYKQYRLRAKTASLDITQYQLIKYADLAIVNLLYLTIASDIFTKDAYKQNLLYAIRFTLTELLVADCSTDSPIDFWDWEELLPYVKEKYPAHVRLHQFLYDFRTTTIDPSNEQLIHLFLQYLRLCDGGLNSLPLIDFQTDENTGVDK